MASSFLKEQANKRAKRIQKAFGKGVYGSTPYIDRVTEYEQDRREREQQRRNEASAQEALDIARYFGGVLDERKSIEEDYDRQRREESTTVTPDWRERDAERGLTPPVPSGGNGHTADLEAEFQRRSGRGNRLTPFQEYMRATVASMPEQEETRSTDELRRDMNRQNRLARATNRMAADMGGQMLRDQSLIYNPGYTSNLRTMDQTREAQQAKADRATELYQTLSVQRREQEEREKYAALMSNPDFITKSQGDPTIGNKASSTSLAPAERLYQKIFHRNDTKDANGNIKDAAGSDAARFVSDEEAAIFYYLWNTQGAKAAQSYYYDYVENRAGERRAQLAQQQAQAYGEYDPVGASIARVGYNAMSGIGLVDMALQNLTRALGITDRNKPLNYNSGAQLPGQVADALQSGASNFVEQFAVDEIKRINPNVKHPENYAKVASFLYQTGMSMADSSVAIALNLMGIPEPLTLANMGAAAGTRAIREARERGATDGQALAFGISSAIMEALFEKISLDRILEPSYAQTTKAHLLNALKQSFTEGSEEVMTTLANTAADMLIMGDKAELFAIQRQLMEQGVSEKEALGAAFKQWGTGIVGDLLGGLISGFGMGGAKEVGTGLGIFAQGVRQDMQTSREMTDVQNREAAQAREQSLREAYEQAQNRETPQPVQPRQQTAREQNPLQYALDKAQNGETLTKNDARAILEDAPAMQTLRDAGVLAENVRNDSEGRDRVLQAVEALAERQTAYNEARSALGISDSFANTQPVAQERPAPPVPSGVQQATETGTAAEPAQAGPPLPSRAAQEQQSRAETPAAQESAQGASEGLRLPSRAEASESKPTPRANLTIGSRNVTLNENRQEADNGRKTEAADAERFRAEARRNAAGRQADGGGQWSTGVARLLDDVRNYRTVRDLRGRADQAASLQNQADARNLRYVSGKELGVEGASDAATARILDNDMLGREWEQTVKEYAAKGVTLRAMTGQIETTDLRANGLPVTVRAWVSGDGKNIIVQADHPTLSWQQLLAHEELHRRIKGDDAYRRGVQDALLADEKLKPYLSRILDRYTEAYRAVKPGITDAEIVEELLADYRAGFDMLDPLGLQDRNTAKAAKAAAKDIRAVEKKGTKGEAAEGTGTAQYETNGGKPAPADIEENFAEAKNSVEPPYRLGTKAADAFKAGLSEKARQTYDMFSAVRAASLENTAVMTVGAGKKAHPKRVTIADRFLTAADWNDQVKNDPEFAQAAKNIFSVIPADIRKNARLNDDGTISETEFEKRFKMARSLVQRLVDALPKGVVDSTVELDGKDIRVARGRVTASVGGEEYRRALIAEKRRLYEEGSLPTRAIGTLSHDNWGAMGFLATNTKTIASGDFTTFCPQMYFNDGCWYCYRRAALTSGVNNKLTAETVWYAGEILQLRQADIDRLNEVGGLRIQSFGDWMTQYSTMLADMLIDAEKVGLQIKIITKEPSMIDTVALLKEQGLGKSLYFNLSADYTIERRGQVDNTNTSDALPMNPERPFLKKENAAGEEETWWKRALTVQEANEYRKLYPWVNTRIVATNLDEFIRGLQDSTVDVVTGYHGDIRQQERVSSETGETLLDVEPLGDAGMPRFAYDRKTGEWTLEYEGKSRYQKQLAQRIQEEGLEREYYTKSCCIFGRCAKCQGKCGSYARSFEVKNATNRDQESVKYWQREMESGVDNPLLESQQEGKASIEIGSPVTQEIGSADTSRNQVASLFTNKRVKFGDVNIDIGGGKWDKTTNYLAERGTKNMIFDPFNRSEESNTATLDFLRNGDRADTATCANVLNVIKEPAARANVILETAKAIKPDGTAYFVVYEGNGTGEGKETRDGWQENRKTEDYMDEIRQYFGDVQRYGKLIEARQPNADLPEAQWGVTPNKAIGYSIEIDPEVAAQFSPQAIAEREARRSGRTGGKKKVSKVRSNTYEYSGLYNEVEAQMSEADEQNFTYDPISEKKSMNEALGRLRKDFDGEVGRLSEADRQWGGSDLDTAMGILHRYRTEGRATGDYGDFWRWSKVIQEKGTKGGQFIQAFAKYTRTGTGAAMKGAKDIHDRFKLNPAQQKQVDAAKKKLMDGIDGDMNGAAQDAMKQAKGKKEPTKKQDGKVDKKKLDAEVQRRKDAERLVREISKLFEKQQDHGEPVENWLNLTGEELARKIAGRFSEPKQRTKTTMQTILSDLVGFAEEHALPDRKKAEGAKRTAIDIITDYLNNRDAYGTAWAAAQSYLRAAYTDDQEKLDALNSFLTATIAYNAEGTDRTMLDAILQSADVLGISEKRILELTSAGATNSTIDRIGDELVSQIKERMGADYDESFTQQLKDAVRRHITGIALQESAEEQRLRLSGMTTDAARQLEINLQKLLTQSRGDKNKASQSVADYLIRELGIPSSDAAIAAERITGAFMDELASRADRKLQQMFAEKKPKTQEQRDKLLDLIRLGGLTNSNVEDAVVDALGIGGMSRERQRELVGVMAQFGETLDAMEADDAEGLRQLIREQAAVRGTKLSRLSEKTLSGETDIEYLRDFALAQLASIAGDFEKRSAGEMISTYQTISHLLNARTALRNFTSNQVFDLIDSAANNVSLLPDIALSLMTGKRTVGLNKSWASQQKRQGALQGMRRNALEVNLDVGVDDRQKSKYGTAGRRTWAMASSGTVGKILSKLEEVMGYELNTSDEFHKGSVMGETLESLARFVDRGDMTLEEAQEFAKEMALYRSFQDDSMIGTMLSAIKDALNIAGVGEQNGKKLKGKSVKDFGLGDFVTKYTQVPGALVHRAIEFSPLGLAKFAYHMGQLANAKRQGYETNAIQRKAALSFGRLVTGTGLIQLFATLAKAGLLRRDDEEDKNAKAAHQAQGLNGTQLNLTALGRMIEGGSAEPEDGDILIDINFLEPLDALMGLGTLVANEDKRGLESYVNNSITAVWDSISSLSMMQTLRDAYNVYQYYDDKAEDKMPLMNQMLLEIASSSLSGFVPSPVRQLAQATDTIYRDQYRSKNINDQMRDKVMNSIPGLRTKLAPKITPLGEDKKYEKPVLNALNAMLNPGNISVYKSDKIVSELERVYDETENANIWPERNAPYSFKVGKEKYTLTPDERTQYQRTRGQETAKMMEEVIGTDWYKTLDPAVQADVLNWIGLLANDLAKADVLRSRGVKYESSTYGKYEERLSNGESISDVVRSANRKMVDYMEAGLTMDEIDELKGLKGKEQRDRLKSMDLTDNQKLTVYKNLTDADSRAEKFQELMNAGLSFNEVMNIYDKYEALDKNDELKASDQAKEFSLWVDKQSYTAKQKAAIKEQMKYWQMTPAGAERYEKFTNAGFSPDVASAIDHAISELTPLPGHDGVTNAQKWNAALGALGKNASQEDKLKAVGMITGTEMKTESGKPTQWANINRVVDSGKSVEDTMKLVEDEKLDVYVRWMDSDAKAAGVKSDTYISFREKYNNTKSVKDANGKDVKGQTKKDQMMAYINGLNLTADQKDKLFLEEYAESGLKDTPWHKGGGRASGSYARIQLPTQKQPWEMPTRSKLTLPSRSTAREQRPTSRLTLPSRYSK